MQTHYSPLTGIGFLDGSVIFNVVWFDLEKFSGSYFGFLHGHMGTKLTGRAGWRSAQGACVLKLFNWGSEKGTSDRMEKVNIYKSKMCM